MLRWILVAAFCAHGAACKVVHSTAGADASTGDMVSVGFARDGTNAYEGASFGVYFTLSAPVDQPVDVTFTVSDITATLDSDYAVASRAITFAPGETAFPINVVILADDMPEGIETFAIEIESADGLVFDRRRHVVTIVANAMPSAGFETDLQQVNETVAGSIGVRLSEPSSALVYVQYTVAGTATSADHQLVPGEITFFPGSIRELLPVPVINDAIDEPNETVIVTLTSASNATLSEFTTHTYTIRDDDFPPYASFETVTQSVAEGDLGTQTVTAQVQLSAPSLQTVSVPFTIDTTSTATADVDYRVLTASPLTFAPGTTTATITMSVVSDKTLEGNERFILQLQAPTNAGGLGFPAHHIVEIANDDCLGSGAFAVCPVAPLASAVALPADLNTDDSGYCASQQPARWQQNGQPPACVVFARSITVDTTNVRGGRVLVLAATDSITIANLLDVSAPRGYTAAGSPYATWCASLATPGPRAGGAGGSFMTAGGAGGAHQNPAGAGGLAAPAETQPPSVLRAGCDGQLGGDNFASYGVGRGGGAVYLVSGGSITLQPGAAINASGHGGSGSADPSNGGSGGGSGGMIMLVAETISASMAYLVANGGGGAEGSTASTSGTDGSDPTVTAPLVPATGGTGTPGGNGGNGFAQGSPATSGSSGTNNNGAGGGGGGAGYIFANQPLTGAIVSPAP